MTHDSVPAEPRTSYWEADPLLRRLLARRLTPAALAFAVPKLVAMGRVAAETVAPLAAVAERNPPRLVDGRVEYHEAYRAMEDVAYGSGMIAIKYDADARAAAGAQVQTIGFALGYLFGQAESGIFCPVCMTDGAARVLEQSGDEALARTWVPRLCFTRPEDRTTGAMFLSERQGGSDVGASTVRAVGPRPDGAFCLFGEKYFCSNADAEVALVLARPEGAPGGTRGLGLFLLPRDLDEGGTFPSPLARQSRSSLPGRWQPGIRLRKLKDKFGTRSMPTGEIDLEGAVAWPVGPLERGFKQMAEMVNYSRLYNATGAAAGLARACYEAEHWSRERHAFGRRVEEHPLARATLDALRTEHAAALALVLEAIAALERADGGDAEGRALMRGLTPLAKYHTAKAAVAGCSEAMEVVGGNGYMEDRCLPRLLRDTQVLPIWEGTTNIQIHDAVRALRVDGSGLALAARLRRALGGADVASALRAPLAARIDEAVRGMEALASTRDEPDGTTRHFWDRTTRTIEAALLAEAGEPTFAEAILDGRTLIR
ncbi:MAG: acyl-CoA dehydrogenase family protein [Myxococcota bacterium]